MANYYGCLVLQRLFLPLFLTACIIFRPCGLSGIYLLLLLYLPFVPVATPQTMAGHTGHFLRAVLVISVLTSLTQLAFQIVLLSMPPYGHFLEKCELLEKILRHVGLVRLDGISAVDCITWLAPEIVAVFASVLVYTLCSKMTSRERAVMKRLEEPENGTEAEGKQSADSMKKKSNFFKNPGRYLSLVSLCIAGVLRPSVPGSVYFLVFLGGATWVACYKKLQRGYAVILRIIMIFAFVHILVLYTYQFQWIQEFLAPDSPYARYFGLTRLLSVNCTNDIRTFQFESTEWTSYVNPLALVFLFYVTVFESSLLLQPKLIRGVSPSRKYGSKDKTDETAGEAKLDEIPLEQLGNQEEEYKSGIFEQIVYSFASVFYVIIRSSYIATNIIMMVWSITYHSWLTFVLLLWANLMWLFPNQRRSMLRSSPVIVVYAEFLLLVQYIYGMDLTEEELPSKIQNFNLKQFGFYRPDSYPCAPLLVKTLYTTMFWITMRQFMKERQEEKQTSTLADMVAPLQVTVSAATATMNQEADPKSSRFMQVLGDSMKLFLTKFWIWVVAIMLFVIGITGTRMTGFRIIYMALFLIFILTFQLSWKTWRKMMYGFWLTVIIYSMLILVLIYTYQFDGFENYWQIYLRIPHELQRDIGLDLYETEELFVKLITPTFFVIITVIQMHYFHKDFLALSDIKSRSRTTSVAATDIAARSEASSFMGGPYDPVSQTDWESSKRSDSVVRERVHLHNIKHATKDQIINTLVYARDKIYEFLNLVWLFLELHMIKIVMLSAILLCVYDVNPIHFVFFCLTIISMSCSSKGQIIVRHVLSVLVSIMFLARMIYQIQYIDHSSWDVNCTNSSTTYNNAEWLGFRKTVKTPALVKGYIGFLAVVTFHAVVNIRQTYHRQMKNKSSRPFLMFPKITRADADKDTFHCVKYLFNYGYYKFGVELSLIATMALIGTRMDFYALLYSCWLCGLFTLRRHKLVATWPFFLIFITVLLPIQYCMVVGFPPGFCIEFPWNDSETLRRTQDWLFLPDYQHPPPAYKLICDFILLMFVSRQQLVFRIEKRYSTDTNPYPGGSNRNIIKNADVHGFVNPVPDYVTYIRSWLDIWKRLIFKGFLWASLAIVFLTGTNRVNVFSLGYLVGSFVLLWQGSDLYLKPIHLILRSWNMLLGYNVTVVMLKVLFQIIGCIFIKDFQENACWLIQLFGVGCISKFGSLSARAGFTDADKCVVPREDVGLVWDGICFGFLILQRRLFKSYYFFHIVDETKAMTILASRGAELIEELRQKQIEEQEETEHKILEKIKLKMDRIKATQQKLHGPSITEPTDHYVDIIFGRKDRPQYQHKTPKSHIGAIRSGDYYMFDTYDEDDNMELLHEKKEDSEKDEAFTLGDAPKKPKDHLETVESGDELDEKKDDEQKPSGSRFKKLPDDDEPLSTLSAITEPEEQKITIKRKIINMIMFIWAILQSAMISITFFLNKFSRDYRYVMKVLKKEKQLLKEKSGFRVGIRRGSGQVWQPIPSSYQIIKKSSDDTDMPKESEQGEQEESPSGSQPSKDDTGQVERARQTDVISGGSPSIRSTEMMLRQERLFHSDSESEELYFDRHKESVVTTLPEIRILAPSLERGLDTSDSASYEGPMMEDLEGAEMSSVDQPPIIRMLLSIWFLILSHSDLLCYFIIFLNQIKSASVISLPLPMMVFLWGSLTIPRPTKSFWITIIAYTQMIVLIKCIFQFEVLPWNQNVVANNPFGAAKIMGIERKPNYALYDLLLLLTLFFHRFMLKSLGLWKSSYAPLPFIQNMEYRFDSVALIPGNTSHSSIKDSADVGRKLAQAALEDEKKLLQSETESTSKDTDPILVNVTIDDERVLGKYPTIIKLSASKYADHFYEYFKQLLNPQSRIAADVYAYMFMCDFFNFMVVIFGFSAFGTQQGDGGVSAYLQENKVPVPFLVMLILQFMLMIIDRALFLRKFILGKIIFQYFMIFGVHIWMFFILPAVTERQFNALLPPQMWYMVKCFYLLLSAYQIRCGFPSRVLGNFLCKSYNLVNQILFNSFMNVPFLFELRTIMDWIWTDTSMTLFDWLKMEDIFAHIFKLKCSRQFEDKYPQPRGTKKSPVVKYLMGGTCMFIIIGFIWFPLVLFALGNTVGQPNIPYDVTMKVRIGPYEPIFSMSAQTNSITQLTEAQFSAFGNVYKRDRVAQTFLSNYEAGDVAAVNLNSNSAVVWNISPPDLQKLIEEVASNRSIIVRNSYTISRESNNKENPGIVTETREVSIPAMINKTTRNPARDSLLKMLNSTEEVQPVLIENLMPKFVKVTNLGLVKPVTQLLSKITEQLKSPENDTEFRNITIKIKGKYNEERWWELNEACSDNIYNMILNFLPMKDCKSLIMYTFNEKSFPKTLSAFSGGGIIGLYTTIVIVAWRLARGIFAGGVVKIMFDDLPNVDRILQLCLDIYLVRESGELTLEEDLFAKLVFLFRSPETLIKWTRPKEENTEDDDAQMPSIAQ